MPWKKLPRPFYAELCAPTATDLKVVIVRSDIRSLVTWLTAGLAGIFAVIGAVMVIFGDSGSTNIVLFGQRITSSSVGTVSLFVGAVMAATVFLKVIASVGLASHEGEAADTGQRNQLVISWREMTEAATKLAMALTSSKGFRPDVIIGICGGGLVFADLLSKRLGHVPCLSLWADRFGPANKSVFAEPTNSINMLNFDDIFEKNNVRRVLIVDDVSYSGETLAAAVKFILNKSKMVANGNVLVKTAVLFSLENSAARPDYSGYTDLRIRKISPVSDALR